VHFGPGWIAALIANTPMRNSPGMQTEVCITVDVEFSIGGAFAAPFARRPIAGRAVECPVNGKEQGLGFLLEQLAAHRIRATFFVETLNSVYFGPDVMGRFAKRIAEAGHDIQAHLHPCWLFFRNQHWAELLITTQPNDSCSTYSVGELCEMLELSIDIFRQWGLPRPVALRVGNLDAGPNVYAAMSRTGFHTGSNIALSLCRPRDDRLHFSGGRHWIDGILELPVLNFRDIQLGRMHHDRSLTIAGTSSAEIEWLLLSAHRNQVSPVVILTHPFEFVFHKNNNWDSIRRNRTTQARLVRLLKFLDENRDKFTATTINACGSNRYRNAHASVAALSVPPVLAAGRMIHKKFDEYGANTSFFCSGFVDELKRTIRALNRNKRAARLSSETSSGPTATEIRSVPGTTDRVTPNMH
jgi:hypothetical protein